MATDRNKIIVLSIALAISSNAVADNADHCVSIVDSKERLECYDRALRPAKSADKKAANSPRPKNIDTNVVSRAKGIAKEVTEKQTSVPRGALKEELPRKADRIIKKEDDPTRYTVTRIVRKYGGKIEFVTDNDRRFRKISTSDYLFEVGDVLVAKRGVFESVFLINQDGKRIKVKIVN